MFDKLEKLTLPKGGEKVDKLEFAGEKVSLYEPELTEDEIKAMAPAKEDLTCFRCKVTDCLYRDDWYNTDGDCLAMK